MGRHFYHKCGQMPHDRGIEYSKITKEWILIIDGTNLAIDVIYCPYCGVQLKHG